jgi:hypothetical protein
MATARILSVNSIQILIQKSEPPKAVVMVSGIAATPGYRNVELAPLEKVLSPDGIFDFEFVGTPPSGIVIPVLSPVSADFVIEKDVERLIGVKVHARSNDLTELVSNVSAHPSFEQMTAAVADPAGRQRDVFTTLALGEENKTALAAEEAKTMAFGEEGKTLAKGEEGKTLAFGEEGKTLAVGEEGKTLAFGEEGKTLAIGEEGSTRPNIEEFKTFRINEEGKTFAFSEEGTTFRIGEEGGKPFVAETNPATDNPFEPKMPGGEDFDPSDPFGGLGNPGPFGRR